MCRNLAPSPYSDVVQRPLAFEARECSFHRWPLGKQRLPRRGLLQLTELRHEFLVTLVYLDDRPSCKLLPDQLLERSARISLVCHNVPGTKARVSEAGFRQQIRCSLSVMDIAGADIGRDGQFVFSVNNEVQFPPKDKLSLAMGVLLDRPSGLSVGMLGLPTIDPALQGAAVHCDPLSKPWQLSVVPAYQRAADVLDQGQVLRAGEFLKEPREGRFVGDVLGPRDATGFSNVGIVDQGPYQGSGRLQAHHVLGNETVPQNFYRVPLGASTSGAYESRKERGVVQLGEDIAEFLNDGWRLNRCANDGIINGDQREVSPFLSGSGGVGVSRTCASAFLLFSVLRFPFRVNSGSCINTTNLLSIYFCSRHKRGSYRTMPTDTCHGITESVALSDVVRLKVEGRRFELLTSKVVDPGVRPTTPHKVPPLGFEPRLRPYERQARSQRRGHKHEKGRVPTNPFSAHGDGDLALSHSWMPAHIHLGIHGLLQIFGCQSAT